MQTTRNGDEDMAKYLVVQILPDGSIHVETEGMQGSECQPYARIMCEDLNAFPAAGEMYIEGRHSAASSVYDQEEEIRRAQSGRHLDLC